MNIYHRKAIELKYQGVKYAEIAEALEKRFSTGTLQQYFSKKGILCKPYRTYEAEQNKRRTQKITNLLTKNIKRTTELLMYIRDRATETQDYKLAAKLSMLLLKKAGEQINK